MSIDFYDGTDSGVSCGDPVSLRNLSPLTVCAWIYPYGWGQLNFGRIACKELLTPAGWNFFTDNSGDPNGIETISAIRWRATTNTIMRGANYALSLTTWQHIAVRFGTTPALFVNGVEIAYKVYQAGAGAVSSDVGANFLIGNRPDLDRDLDGLMEDVRLYNREIGADEMYAIYQSRGHDQLFQSLVGRWTLTEKAPNQVPSTDPIIDLSENKNNGLATFVNCLYAEGVVALRRVV